MIASSVVILLVCVLVVVSGLVDGNENVCDGFDVTPVRTELKYIGPHQAVSKKGRLHFRCFNAQHWEDLYMFQNYFGHLTDGFFIELGALDGYSYSASYFFEKFLNWKGLLIEASPQNHIMYKARMKMLPPQWRRQRADYVQAAVCSEPKALHYVAKEGTGAGILEFMPPDQQQRNKRICKPETEGGTAVAIEKKNCVLKPIKCVHLGDLLREKKVAKVDLFILDVEGAELNVLQTLRLDEIPVHFFLIELDGKSPEKDAQVRCILRRHKYEPIGRLDLNELWQKRDFPLNTFKSSYGLSRARSWSQCFRAAVSPATFFKADTQVSARHLVASEEVNVNDNRDNSEHDNKITVGGPEDSDLSGGVAKVSHDHHKKTRRDNVGTEDSDFMEFGKVHYHPLDGEGGDVVFSPLDVLFWVVITVVPLFVVGARFLRRRRR